MDLKSIKPDMENSLRVQQQTLEGRRNLLEIIQCEVHKETGVKKNEESRGYNCPKTWVPSLTTKTKQNEKQ